MSQVSRSKMTKDIQKRVALLLSEALTVCETREVAQNFLMDLLTPVERVMLSKRLAIALMLEEGYSYTQIKMTLKVSSPTIARVREWMSERGTGFEYVMNRVKQKQFSRKFIATITDLLVVLATAPGKGRNKSTLMKIRKGSS